MSELAAFRRGWQKTCRFDHADERWLARRCGVSLRTSARAIQWFALHIATPNRAATRQWLLVIRSSQFTQPGNIVKRLGHQSPAPRQMLADTSLPIQWWSDLLCSRPSAQNIRQQ
jgi:hypothetical protein